MENFMTFVTSKWYWIVIVFGLTSQIGNLVISFLDGLETVLKNFGKPYSWIDKITNIIGYIVKFTSYILNFINANKKK